MCLLYILGMKDEESQDQDAFKDEVKRWLQHNRYDYKWLAAQIGLAVGTVRNWFYTAVPITAVNQRRIKAALDAAESKIIPEIPHCLVFTKAENFEVLDLIASTVGADVKASDFSGELGYCGEESDRYGGFHRIQNSAWRVAIEITRLLNDEARAVIQAHLDAAGDKTAVKFLALPKAVTYIADKGGEMPEASASAPTVQVLEAKFHLLYAKTAAKLQGYDSVEEWVSATLDAIAERLFLQDFGFHP